MIIVMEPAASEEQIQNVVGALVRHGFDAHRSSGASRTVIGAVGNLATPADPRGFELLPGVHQVVTIAEPYKLAGRAFRPEGSVVRAGSVALGGPEVVVAAGPCAVEGRDQVKRIAESVSRSGARLLRGGAFKPRTSPYSFQGLAEEGLRYLREAADEWGLCVVTEVMDPSQIALVEEYSDIHQVGARNMQNFSLLKDLGRSKKPVLLKRGLSATLEEWLLSAEYIMAGGNHSVILCERGIRTFERYTRSTMDISAIPILKKLSHLPVVADPSHGTGIRDKVIPMARAAVAAGADGLLVEVHHDPEKALSDGPQSLYPEQFAALMGQLQIIVPAVGRRLHT
jgi:3-deoxy-7-phosphoheptulonate synthase